MWRRARRNVGLFALMLPTLASMAVFGYYPKIDVFFKSLYRWQPGFIEEYIATKNFQDAFGDPLFWQSFKVVMIMLAANLVKMWPGIIVAVALHRVLSNRMRYGFQVLFVVPMVVPGMVWLLVWKSFYDPDFGILNRLLQVSGLMSVLGWLDGTVADPGVMPRIASAIQPVLDRVIDPVFGNVWGLLFAGSLFLIFMNGRPTHASRWLGYAVAGASGLIAPYIVALTLSGSLGLLGAVVGVTALVAALAFTLRKGWVIWPFVLLLGLWACREEPWRVPVLVAATVGLAELTYAKFDRLVAPDVVRWVGGIAIGLGSLLVGLGLIWTTPTEQFVGGKPAWLGNQNLILPALIFWGFPWVGTVGVLIYLAGLQQISNDVYEAAELDGVGPIGKLFRIELPLIMTQVRINLIFMTIGTLTGWEFYLILLGDSGGPGNVGLVPGLYMYRAAFINLEYGYACALGVIMFVIILLLTIVYQKYVKVDK